jgi:hypothetical protein
MKLRFALVLCCFAAGCVGGAVDQSASGGGGGDVESALDSVCPTASPGAPSLLFWHTTRQLEHLVWSSDGHQVGGAEYVFEEKKSWNPLDGTTLKRKFCHQLSTYDPKTLARLGYVGPMQPNQVGDITFMQPAGYFTVMTYERDFGGWDFHRVALDGTRKLLAHVDVGCQYGRILPSPNGSRIAYLAVAGHCGNDGQGGNDVVVSFFDGAVNALGQSPSVRVYLDGGAVKVEPAATPRCTDPGTTSSPVAAAGARSASTTTANRLSSPTTPPPPSAASSRPAAPARSVLTVVVRVGSVVAPARERALRLEQAGERPDAGAAVVGIAEPDHALHANDDAEVVLEPLAFRRLEPTRHDWPPRLQASAGRCAAGYRQVKSV